MSGAGSPNTWTLVSPEETETLKPLAEETEPQEKHSTTIEGLKTSEEPDASSVKDPIVSGDKHPEASGVTPGVTTLSSSVLDEGAAGDSGSNTDSFSDSWSHLTPTPDEPSAPLLQTPETLVGGEFTPRDEGTSHLENLQEEPEEEAEADLDEPAGVTKGSHVVGGEPEVRRRRSLLASLERIGRTEEEEEEEEEVKEHFQLPRREEENWFNLNMCILGAVLLVGLGTIFFSGVFMDLDEASDYVSRELKDAGGKQEWTDPGVPPPVVEASELRSEMSGENEQISRLQSQHQQEEATTSPGPAEERLHEEEENSGLKKAMETVSILQEENERMKKELESVNVLQEEVHTLRSAVTELKRPTATVTPPSSGQSENSSKDAPAVEAEKVKDEKKAKREKQEKKRWKEEEKNRKNKEKEHEKVDKENKRKEWKQNERRGDDGKPWKAQENEEWEERKDRKEKKEWKKHEKPEDESYRKSKAKEEKNRRQRNDYHNEEMDQVDHGKDKKERKEWRRDGDGEERSQNDEEKSIWKKKGKGRSNGRERGDDEGHGRGRDERKEWDEGKRIEKGREERKGRDEGERFVNGRAERKGRYEGKRFENRRDERMERDEGERVEKRRDEGERFEKKRDERIGRDDGERFEKRRDERKGRDEGERFEKRRDERIGRDEGERFEKRRDERIGRDEGERFEKRRDERIGRDEGERFEKRRDEKKEWDEGERFVKKWKEDEWRSVKGEREKESKRKERKEWEDDEESLRGNERKQRKWREKGRKDGEESSPVMEGRKEEGSKEKKKQDDEWINDGTSFQKHPKEDHLWGDRKNSHSHRRLTPDQPEYWTHQRGRLQGNPEPRDLCSSPESCAQAEGLLPVPLSEFQTLLQAYLSKAEQFGVESTKRDQVLHLASEFFRDGLFVHDQMRFQDFADDVADILEDLVEGEEEEEEEDSDLEDEMEDFGKEAVRRFLLAEEKVKGERMKEASRGRR